MKTDDLLHFRWSASFDSSILQYPAAGKLGNTSLIYVVYLVPFPLRFVEPKHRIELQAPLR